MKRNIITIICLFLVALTSTVAAEPQNKAQKEQWFKNMVQTKVDYLAKQMNLTADQRAKFEKQYTAMSAETSKLARETRALQQSISKKEKATDVEYEKAAEAIAEFKSKEGAIELRYFNQFKAYLSKKQLFTLKLAEHKWMKELMRQRHKGKK